MQSRLNKDVCVIYNCLIDEEYKLNRLLNSIDELIQLNPKEIRVRVRGKQSRKAIIKLESLKNNDDSCTQLFLYEGDDYREWKLNTLKMYLNSATSYVILMQEDYKLFCSPEKFIDYLNLGFSQNVDYIRLSNPSIISNSQFFEMNSANLISTYILTKDNWPHYKFEQRYILSFPGCYQSDIFLKNLTSKKPYVRKYHPYSPFDFEKGPDQIWLLPLKCAVAKFEILSCIDDDLGFPGSSLQSRGLIEPDCIRNHNHASKWSSRNIFFKMSNISRKVFKNSSLTSYEKLPKKISILISKLLNLVYRVLFFLDILKYSAHAQFYFYFNFRGHFLRKKAKLKLFKAIDNATY